ncbi:MAG: hypothetical protein QF645_02315, partial [Planctomycetota bacterium]|nr:hypothetical protein [Planctomycetota bacterium]
MFLSHACALLFLSGLIPLQEQAETDQVSSKFLSRIDQAIEEAKWEPLFLLYEEALERHRYRVAPDPKIEGIQVGMVEYLVRRYASLPKEAFEVYRNMRDAHAEQALESALQEEDSIALDRALSLYFFASMSDTYLDRFARYLQERGRYNDALLYWNRLLRFYPDSDIPKEVVLARMAVSCQLAGDASQLSQLKKFSQKSLGERLIWIGRNKKKLSHFLDSIEIAPFSEKLTNALPVPMATRVPQQGEPRY